jgi:hypothetical protein
MPPEPNRQTGLSSKTSKSVSSGEQDRAQIAGSVSWLDNARQIRDGRVFQDSGRLEIDYLAVGESTQKSIGKGHGPDTSLRSAKGGRGSI